MKPFFPGGRQGTGTHGGPQYGKHYPHHSTPTPAPSPSNPNTPLSKIGAANAEITRGNIKAGVAILEEAAFEGAQAGSQDIGAQVLTTRLIMAYEEHGVIEQDGKTGGITVSRQERAFTIATHAKAVAEALAAKEKKTGSLPVILTAALRGKTTKDFAAIAVKQENAILAVTTVPDPIPAPATTTTPKPVEPVRTASTPAPTPTPSPVPQPIRVTEAGVAPTQDDTNSRAAALLEQAETADREGQEARRSDILRNRFAPLVASVTDQELLTRARRLIRRTGDVIPELAPPAAQPITVTVAGVGTPIPVPPPPPPVPEPPKAPAIDPALQARIDPFLRSGKGRLASKDYLGAIIAFKQILAVVPDHLEARAGLNACAAGILVNAERAYSSGQEKGAITILRKQFMSAEPTDPEILLRARALAERLGETIPGLTLEKPIKPSDPEPAKPAAPAGPVIDRELDLLRAAVTANQQDLMALNNLARALTERKAFDEAKAVLARAQAISLDSKETLLTAIILYGKAGMARERLYAIVLFLNQEQGNLYVLTQLGFYFLQTGDNLHARGAFEHVLDCKPDHESARIGLAQLRGPRPDDMPIIGEVIARARHIVQTWEAEGKGAKVQLLLRAAREALGQGREEESMVKFLEARELDPKNAAITKELGILFSKFRSRALAAKEEGKLPEAKTACELARRIRPEDDQILILQRDIERLLTLAEKRAAQEAAAASAPAPASQPKLQNAAAKRAAAAAQKDLERRKEVLARMAREAEAQGKIADAAAALRGLLKIDPDNTVAKQKLAELSARLAAPAPTPAPTPTPIPEPAPAPKTAANTEVHRTRDPSNRKPEKPPLPAAQVAAGRAAAIAYLRTGDHLELSATMVLADDSKAYWRIYDKRLFPGGIKEAREAARKP